MSSNVESFHSTLRSARRILAVCGAGLSASSGIPTFRGAGGLWRTFSAPLLATPTAFRSNPALVWQFYSLRRHVALSSHPNAAHYALAQLSKNTNVDFKCITQNVDDLSVRAGHVRSGRNKAEYIHGSLFRVRCSRGRELEGCGYDEYPNIADPIAPGLRVPVRQEAGSSWEDIKEEDWPEVSLDDVPKCPDCGDLLRPSVVWFEEALDSDMLDRIDAYIDDGCDLCIVVGTSGKVYPAAGYASSVKARGGKVAIVDLDPEEYKGREDRVGGPDWVFKGDAAELLPMLLEPVIGKLVVPEKEPGWEV